MPEVAVEVRQCPLRFGTRNGGGAEEEAEEKEKATHLSGGETEKRSDRRCVTG